jgi:hypothetical protein
MGEKSMGGSVYIEIHRCQRIDIVYFLPQYMCLYVCISKLSNTCTFIGRFLFLYLICDWKLTAEV